MSHLFTAVSSEQQEIVAGGGDKVFILAGNNVDLTVTGDKNDVKIKQKNIIKRVRA
ncbi:MAG: hypothetical protein ACKO11_05675 [Cuspidothrix sp.]